MLILANWNLYSAIFYIVSKLLQQGTEKFPLCYTSQLELVIKMCHTMLLKVFWFSFPTLISSKSFLDE